MLHKTQQKVVATLVPFRTAFWNLKPYRIAVDACVNGMWQLSLNKEDMRVCIVR